MSLQIAKKLVEIRTRTRVMKKVKIKGQTQSHYHFGHFLFDFNLWCERIKVKERS
jgi:hypothetical protein